MKPYKLFWLMKGDVLKIGDTITANNCGGITIEERTDFERLDEKFNTKRFSEELVSSLRLQGKDYCNSVIYITNNSNKIVGIIPINYKEKENGK